MKQLETRIDRFDGGMTTILRGAKSNEARLVKHFDNFTRKNALIPYPNTESGDGGTMVQANNKLQNFLLYGSKLYGLGVQTGGNLGVIYETSTPHSAPSWAVSSNSASAGAITVTDFTMFKEYKGVFYFRNSQGLGSYTVGGSVSDTAYTATMTSVSQAIVHSKDSIMYFGYTTGSNAIIASKNGAGAIAVALTIPTVDYKISSLCEYGNYLAIALAPLADGLNSLVLLWDRDSSVSNISEAVDWGNNNLYAIENIDGYIIGVSIQGNITLAPYRYPTLVFKKYAGGGAVQIKQIVLQSQTAFVGKQKHNNRLYFGLTATSLIDAVNSGTTNDLSGIWSIGRNGENDPFTVNFDKSAANSGVITMATGGFYIFGDYAYIAHTVGSTPTLTKTHSTSTSFATISTWESPYIATISSSITKKLIGVTLTFEKIPTSGSVSLYYRADGATSWTLIFTDSTAGDYFHDAINIESAGATLPQYNEVEFQIISKGVIVTGLFFEEEEITNALY